MEGGSDWRIKKANRKEKKLQESRKMQKWQRQKKYIIKISVRTKKIRTRCGKKDRDKKIEKVWKRKEVRKKERKKGRTRST